jgi:prevent-host-death family protein
MIQPSDIHTLTDFKRRSTEMISELEASGRPQVLTVDGSPKVVVLGVAAFERMAALAERAETTEAVRRGLEDVKAGRTTPAAQIFEEVRRTLDLPPRA